MKAFLYQNADKESVHTLTSEIDTWVSGEEFPELLRFHRIELELMGCN